jgi:hypothetical protein
MSSLNFNDSLVADERLIRLFQRHFDDPVAALRRLDRHLANVELSFDFKTQLRELTLRQ